MQPEERALGGVEASASAGDALANEALAVLEALACVNRRIAELIEADAAPEVLHLAGRRSSELERRYRELACDPRTAPPAKRRALALALEDAARWTALAREASGAARHGVSVRARSAAALRRRLGFYQSTAPDGRSCDVAG